jgi:protein-L-isoaspartate(D-aspartate) O-methyltransferase
VSELPFGAGARGIGMTSQRTRDRMIARLREKGIRDETVLAAMASVPRHLGRVLEVGTGCGYQAAVLAQVASEVYSIERIAGLLERARANLRALRLANLRLVHGDGARGLPDAAPFDGIVVAAASPKASELLLQQLAVGGRMIAPLGAEEQALCLIERTTKGFTEKWLDAVRFVPLRAGKQ